MSTNDTERSGLPVEVTAVGIIDNIDVLVMDNARL